MGREDNKVPASPVRAVKIRIEEAKVMRIRMSLSATNITSALCQTRERITMTWVELKRIPNTHFGTRS